MRMVRTLDSRGLYVMLLLTLVSGLACESLPERAPKLLELERGDGSKRSGKCLMSLDEGVVRIEGGAAHSEVMDVVVHGYESRGYEWVHALKRFGEAGHEVWFYRWDWQVCPEEGAATLRKHLAALLPTRPTAKKLRVFGHSYGGVITALMAKSGPLDLPMDVHVIAAPLAGMGRMKSLCGFEGLGSLPTAPGVEWFQWRTQHTLDGAFRDQKVDPQLVDFGAGMVTTLPDLYRGHRLGHNWSISWVADTLAGASPASGD